MSPVPDLPTTLRQLHDSYIERLNAAIAEDRNDLVDALTAEFTDVALSTMLATETHAR
jgi:hypothetical protein